MSYVHVNFSFSIKDVKYLGAEVFAIYYPTEFTRRSNGFQSKLSTFPLVTLVEGPLSINHSSTKATNGSFLTPSPVAFRQAKVVSTGTDPGFPARARSKPRESLYLRPGESLVNIPESSWQLPWWAVSNTSKIFSCFLAQLRKAWNKRPLYLSYALTLLLSFSGYPTRNPWIPQTPSVRFPDYFCSKRH